MRVYNVTYYQTLWCLFHLLISTPRSRGQYFIVVPQFLLIHVHVLTTQRTTGRARLFYRNSQIQKTMTNAPFIRSQLLFASHTADLVVLLALHHCDRASCGRWKPYVCVNIYLRFSYSAKPLSLRWIDPFFREIISQLFTQKSRIAVTKLANQNSTLPSSVYIITQLIDK